MKVSEQEEPFLFLPVVAISSSSGLGMTSRAWCNGVVDVAEQPATTTTTM